MDSDYLVKKIEASQKKTKFSGTVYVSSSQGEFVTSYGYANRNEKIKNKNHTRYGIASGSKFITSIAICQLIDRGMLSFDAKLSDCLDVKFPFFAKEITVKQLLTHTSGIPDYFDEEVMDDFEELWLMTPMYHMRDGKDFLPLFQENKMMFTPGDRFHYNNAGYVVLGLIVEQLSGLPFSTYVEQNVFQEAGMKDSGFFEMDALPVNTALGYIDLPDGSYKTNIYSIPAKGGADGGVFVTAKDMMILWQAVKTNKLMSHETTLEMLKPRVRAEDEIYYGYAGYMQQTDNHRTLKHILIGYDPGVNFRSVHYPDEKITVVVCSNKNDGAYEMVHCIENHLLYGGA